MRSSSSISLGIRCVIVGAGLALAGLATRSTPAGAAEQVVLRYRILERSVSIEELATFVETGETSKELDNYLEMSGQNPERVQQFLSREIDVDVVPLDRLLNSAIGETMLDEMGDFVHTSSGTTNREALRSALVLSASDDSKISLIEVLQNYPTQEIHVNGNRLATVSRQIQNLQAQVGDLQEYIMDALEVIGLP